MRQAKERCLSAGARYAVARTDSPVQEVLAGLLLASRRSAL
jgi:hypothetical protein